MYLTTRLLFAVIGVLLLAPSRQSVAANNMLIWPVDPVILAQHNSTELWIENKSLQPTTMQVRVFGWTQNKGSDDYRVQQDVVASPPIVQIEAGQKQLIRLIKQTPVLKEKEQAYRVLIDEVPALATAKPDNGGITLQMRYSIPLFVYGVELSPAEKAANQTVAEDTVFRALSWQIVREGKQPFIEIRNQSAFHVRLSHVSLGNNVLVDGLFGYVLADSTRKWPLPTDINVTAATFLRAQVNHYQTLWQSASAH